MSEMEQKLSKTVCGIELSTADVVSYMGIYENREQKGQMKHGEGNIDD